MKGGEGNIPISGVIGCTLFGKAMKPEKKCVNLGEGIKESSLFKQT